MRVASMRAEGFNFIKPKVYLDRASGRTPRSPCQISPLVFIKHYDLLHNYTVYLVYIFIYIVQLVKINTSHAPL